MRASGRTWGGVLVLTGLALSSIPWHELPVSRAEPPQAPCVRHDVDCGELFKGRIACMKNVNYGTYWHAGQVTGWRSDGRKITLPVAHCVFVADPK